MEFIPREIDGDIMVIEADGGLDGTNAARFSDDVLAIVDGGIGRLIIDCARLTHVSSVGLGALIRIRSRAAKAGGDVKLCNVSGLPMQVLHASRLDRVFGLYPDLNRARLAFLEPDGG
ncbi:MAG: STAS domain-containing protein [Phycisphaerales bacterium]|jgi:anti-anti-sigma factor|nr:STAS domain-containing protein [Phycisphaerales bacterium]